MRKLAAFCLGLLSILAIYLLLGHFVFPAPSVELSDYFRPGDRLASRYEGFDQTVLGVNDGWLHTRLVVAPNAAGPPEHFHEHFAETFTVKSGTLSLMVNGEKKTLTAGETLTVPPLIPHKPFNETDERVVVEGPDERTIPIEFGYHLVQLYGFLDSHEGGASMPQMLMQLSVYGSEADSYIAGPPLVIQKAMRLAMAPAARLAGYRNFYPEHKPVRD